MGKTKAPFCKGKKSMIIDKHGRKVEGYWWSSYSPEYPKPTANVLSEEEAQQIFELIRKKERTAKKTTYRGFSTSRIDKTSVGSSEYSQSDWHWPEALAPHYVLKYKVKPSDEFLEFIGYK